MEEKTYITKSSGKQQDFGTGAKRDTQQGKGRFDLIPSRALTFVAERYGEYGKTLGGNSPKNIGDAISCLYSCLDKNNDCAIEDAADAVWYVLEYMEHDKKFYEELPEPNYELGGLGTSRYDLIPYSSLKRVADVYERGANLYGERNWEKGMPLSRLLDSSIRHLFQVVAGKNDEDHAAQGAWNALGFIETLWRIEHSYLPGSLDDRFQLEKIKTSQKSCQHKTVDRDGDCLSCGEDHENICDGYGFNTKPMIFDGYGAEHRKTLFGQIVGSPTKIDFDEGAFDFDDESVDEKDW